jgi:hypothetical protein
VKGICATRFVNMGLTRPHVIQNREERKEDADQVRQEDQGQDGVREGKRDPDEVQRDEGQAGGGLLTGLHVCGLQVGEALQEDGLDGLRGRKPTGRPAIRDEKARKLIPELMKKDPQAYGFLKGRWVVRDVDVNPTPTEARVMADERRPRFPRGHNRA